MDKVKDLGRSGWHSERTESIKGRVPESLKGNVRGLIGRDNPSDREKAQDHVSQPLSSLKDPRSFGAPPKHVKYYGEESIGSPTASTPRESNSLSSREVPKPQHLTGSEEEEDDTKPPPGPFRIDTTGLSTDNLPKPPLRRNDQGASSPSIKPALSTQSPTLPHLNKPKPSLPPRLPPRQSFPTASQSNSTVPKSPPPSYSSTFQSSDKPSTFSKSNDLSINQNAIDRLSKAGVNVPGLGIGSHPENRDQDISTATESPSSSSVSTQLSELQSRFAKMDPSKSSTGIPATPTSPPRKKPPLPPKKSGLPLGQNPRERDDQEDRTLSPGKPPPVPLGTKPR